MLISVAASMTWPDATIGRHRLPNSVFEQYGSHLSFPKSSNIRFCRCRGLNSASARVTAARLVRSPVTLSGILNKLRIDRKTGRHCVNIHTSLYISYDLG